ncbi:MAG: class I SAM-dependent rRNA methyltransferase [Bryobacteraceae bacterium]
MAAVRVNGKAVSRIESGHLWVFSSDVIDRGSAAPGDAVRIVDARGRSLGTAHYSSTSQIALRLLSRRGEPIDREFVRCRILAAENHRKLVVRDSEAYRLVHAEGDLLPGLVIDRYRNYFIVQLLDQGMDRVREDIAAILKDLFAPTGIVARNDVAARAKEDLPLEVAMLAGDVSESVPVRMNGLAWHVDLLHGQKTGIFLDQRENYMAVRGYASGRALDCFAATGGFAMHLASQCESVEAVDSSGAALEIAETNARANRLDNITFTRADVLDYLPQLVSARKRYSLVVVDPPAFTKSRGAIEGAVRGYKEINLRALRLLESRGILVSCSCSHHMSEARLLEIVAAAALDCGKQLRVLERRTQSRDHPILLTVPETHYLKCLICEVIS